jgi:hypothetical protein
MCANLEKSAMVTLTVIRRAFEEESMSSQLKRLNSPRPKKARQVKRKVKIMLIIFFDINGVAHKEFVLTDQAINSTYYCDHLRWLRENVRRPRPEIWRQKNLLLHHNNTPSLFHQETFDQNQHGCRPSTTLLFSFPD